MKFHFIAPKPYHKQKWHQRDYFCTIFVFICFACSYPNYWEWCVITDPTHCIERTGKNIWKLFDNPRRTSDMQCWDMSTLHLPLSMKSFGNDHDNDFRWSYLRALVKFYWPIATSTIPLPISSLFLSILFNLHYKCFTLLLLLFYYYYYYYYYLRRLKKNVPLRHLTAYCANSYMNEVPSRCQLYCRGFYRVWSASSYRSPWFIWCINGLSYESPGWESNILNSVLLYLKSGSESQKQWSPPSC